jgi:hypothetical protein
MASGAGGYETGRLTWKASIPIGKQQTSVFLARIVQTRYWDLPSRRQTFGLDGAQWILEGVTDGHYQIVDRWSPGEGDPIRMIAATLLFEFSGIKVNTTEIY